MSQLRPIWACPLLLTAQALAAPARDQAAFEKTVRPFLERHCFFCHNSKLTSGKLNLEALASPPAALAERDAWEKVFEKLRDGQMPPPGRPVPPMGEKQVIMRWAEARVALMNRYRKPDPGRVTARRLNRAEYNNTIRDLLGVSLRPAADFPTDDSGYGFDNIGDVLSLSPSLMEKYLAAASRIAAEAIVVDTIRRPTSERYESERIPAPKTLPSVAGGVSLSPRGPIEVRHRFPVDAEYEIHAGVGGRRLPAQGPLEMAVLVDGMLVKVFPIEFGDNKPRRFSVQIPFLAGEHTIAAALVRSDTRPEIAEHPSREKDVLVDFMEVRGPFHQQPPVLTESHQRIFVCGHANGAHQRECGPLILSNLVPRAWRRPVAPAEIDRLAGFLALAEKEGDSFEEGMRVALQAILVSPHFLFRIERHPQPHDPSALHPIDEFELSSRLSYFLWSSTPDAELFRLAAANRLRRPGVLAAQLRRMLRDPKAGALTENFAGQWLHLRNLDTVKPDPERFPTFDDQLRKDMYQETKMFFEAVVREDRSILDFIDGRFTFLNQRLAGHYGIGGIQGDEFRRVPLTGGQRSGVLTQASVLTVTSYPTRTSPVLRGLWVLENFLAAPPPPPPPDVPQLDEKEVGATGSLRQQLERHRTDPACAVCHNKMDSLGFGLENYDAVGRWRTRDGKFPIDASGVLPGGKPFKTNSRMKSILRADAASFARCLTEKLLTYALGRGLEPYDRPVVEAIVRKLASDNYCFQTLFLEIVNSLPFQHRRGEAPRTAAAGNGN